jgi:hypothetical protein
MLRINQQSNAEAAKSYHSSPAEYYGAGEQEMIGEWLGKAAARLGLEGIILAHHFSRLCDNRHPFTGERLTACARTAASATISTSTSANRFPSSMRLPAIRRSCVVLSDVVSLMQ